MLSENFDVLREQKINPEYFEKIDTPDQNDQLFLKLMLLAAADNNDSKTVKLLYCKNLIQ